VFFDYNFSFSLCSDGDFERGDSSQDPLLSHWMVVIRVELDGLPAEPSARLRGVVSDNIQHCLFQISSSVLPSLPSLSGLLAPPL